MFCQRHTVSFPAPIARVFRTMLDVLARRRWAAETWFEPDARPEVGRRYVSRNGAVVRCGRIVDCSPPVRLTLYETLLDPPCRVRLQLRWCLEPAEHGSFVRLDTRYELNATATLNRKRWHEEIDAHGTRLHCAVGSRLADNLDQGSGVKGQRTGSSAMTVMNTTAVNGRPSFK